MAAKKKTSRRGSAKKKTSKRRSVKKMASRSGTTKNVSIGARLNAARAAYAKVLGVRASDLEKDIIVHQRYSDSDPEVLIDLGGTSAIPSRHEGGKEVSAAAEAIIKEKLGDDFYIENRYKTADVVGRYRRRTSMRSNVRRTSRSKRRVSKNRRRTSRR
jgi:hypothetical protein